jgi:ferredoxin-NADP reductase
MGTIHESRNGWHAGELAVHKLLHVPTSGRANPTSAGLPPPYAYRVVDSPLVAFGAIDDQGRPWTTVMGGERGFTRPVAQNILGVQGLVDRQYDPVVQALLGNAADGELVRPMSDGGQGKMMSGLSIDLESRDRVKLAGLMVVGAMASQDQGSPSVGELQLAMHVQESLGNCPKYLNKKEISAHIPSPELVSDTLPLPAEAVDLIHGADLFFLSSTNGQTMDTNHRGGPPGFIRVASNSPDSVVIVYPEYSGNQLYQTLGNLYTNPKIGIVIPDFETSSVLYLTGESELMVGNAASALLSHSKLAVKITVTAARFVRDGLPFHGRQGEASPYNPPVRPLVAEQAAGAVIDDSKAIATATLIKREPLTPTVNRYSFRIQPAQGQKPLAMWKPGQHVTFDFSAELDHGWSHMREDDPQSLNDDFVRTFTISNPPPVSQEDAVVEDGTVLEITVRAHGPATAFLARHNLRVPLELPVLGFAGEESFRIPAATGEDGQELPVFVAGGVGITPLLAQAPGLLAKESRDNEYLRLLWSLRATDLPLAVDTVTRIEGLGKRTTLFITGDVTDSEQALIDKVEALGAHVITKRMEKEDILEATVPRKRKFYLCTAPELFKVLTGWLDGEVSVSENFNY